MLYLLSVFNVVCLLGTLLNLDYFYPPAALAQLVMYNEPIVLFLVLVNLPFTMKTIQKFSALLFGLVIVELIIGIMQVPLFIATGNTEQIIGTFYGNAEQYSTFILLGIFLFFARSIFSTNYRHLYYLMSITTLILIILIDNKASWLGIIVSLSVVVVNIMGTKKMLRYRLHLLILFLTLLSVGYWAAQSSKTISKLDRFIEIILDGNVTKVGKLQAYIDVIQSFRDNPHMMFVGSGLGNFYSRASYQFYNYSKYYDRVNINRRYLNKEEIEKGKKEKYQKKTSNSMGSMVEKNEQDPFYAQYYNAKKVLVGIGSGQVDNPFSSYNGLFGETGMLGLMIYLFIYSLLLKLSIYQIHCNRSDPQIFPLAIVGLGLTVYLLTVSVYGMWLDTGRLNTILWSINAIVFCYSQKKQLKIKASQIINHKISKNVKMDSKSWESITQKI